MRSNHIYCLSGLGADERIFSRLTLPGIRLTHLQWMVPGKTETITAYATRMISQSNPENPTFLGVSFGGMMAIEMAKQCRNARVILVSSVKSRKELPPWMRISGQLRLDSLVPSKPWRFAALENSFLGAETEEEVNLVNQFRAQTNPAYLHWAIRQILTWRNEWQPPVLYHIHGSKDKTFPLQHVNATHIIPGGGHFMILNRAKEVSEILMEICK